MLRVRVEYWPQNIASRVDCPSTLSTALALLALPVFP